MIRTLQVCIYNKDRPTCGSYNRWQKHGPIVFSDLDLPVDLNYKWGSSFTEKELIESKKKNLSQNEFACAHHCHTLGTNWWPSQLCQRPLHKGLPVKKTKRDVRTASWLVYKSIEKQFPGGLICTIHRRIEENKNNDVNDDTQLAPDPDFSPQTPAIPCNVHTSKEDLDSFIDTATDISPIKFQMMSPLEDYSVSTIRYAKRK